MDGKSLRGHKMQILIWNDPHDLNIYDVSTEEKLTESLCMIFDENEDSESYGNLDLDVNEEKLYLSAKNGNVQDKCKFIELRNAKGAEYETFQVVETIN